MRVHNEKLGIVKYLLHSLLMSGPIDFPNDLPELNPGRDPTMFYSLAIGFDGRRWKMVAPMPLGSKLHVKLVSPVQYEQSGVRWARAQRVDLFHVRSQFDYDQNRVSNVPKAIPGFEDGESGAVRNASLEDLIHLLGEFMYGDQLWCPQKVNLYSESPNDYLEFSEGAIRLSIGGYRIQGVLPKINHNPAFGVTSVNSVVATSVLDPHDRPCLALPHLLRDFRGDVTPAPDLIGPGGRFAIPMPDHYRHHQVDNQIWYGHFFDLIRAATLDPHYLESLSSSEQKQRFSSHLEETCRRYPDLALHLIQTRPHLEAAVSKHALIPLLKLPDPEKARAARAILTRKSFSSGDDASLPQDSPTVSAKPTL